jgi:hypothetical protein
LIDAASATRFGAGATNQQGAQDKASHQALKARCTHTLRNDCETHPPLPMWWLKLWIAEFRLKMSQV